MNPQYQTLTPAASGSLPTHQALMTQTLRTLYMGVAKEKGNESSRLTPTEDLKLLRTYHVHEDQNNNQHHAIPSECGLARSNMSVM